MSLNLYQDLFFSQNCYSDSETGAGHNLKGAELAMETRKNASGDRLSIFFPCRSVGHSMCPEVSV
jgi:hypothetical protein